MDSVLVVVFSRTGRCDKVAAEFVDALRASGKEAELERVSPVKGYRGLLGFIRGGGDAAFGKLPPVAAPQHDPARFGEVVLVFPIWADKPAAPVSSYVSQHGETIQRARAITVSRATPGMAAISFLREKYRAPIAGHLHLSENEVDAGALAKVTDFARNG